LPSDDAVKLALRTQQVIAHESGIADHPDPFGGSYVVEELTDQLEAEAKAIIAEIDKMGGAVDAIEKGWVQSEIARSAYEHQTKVDAGDQVIVGVNKYTSDETDESDLLSINLSAVEEQAKRVTNFKTNRNNDHARNRLDDLKSIAYNTENLIPPIIECVKHNCTLGEISDTLRSVFGEYQPSY